MNESSQALEAYQAYLSLGPQRSTAKVAQALGKSKTLIDRWSGAHAWVERIAAHERALAQEREQEEADRRRQAREARLGIAANVMSESYKQFMNKAKDGKLTPYAALQALTLAFDTQRRDLGEPDQRVEVAGPEGGAIPIVLEVRRVARGSSGGGDGGPDTG